MYFIRQCIIILLRKDLSLAREISHRTALLRSVTDCRYIYEKAAERKEKRVQPDFGKMVDVGGHKLHLLCMGTPPDRRYRTGAGSHRGFRWPPSRETRRVRQRLYHDRAGSAGASRRSRTHKLQNAPKNSILCSPTWPPGLHSGGTLLRWLHCPDGAARKTIPIDGRTGPCRYTGRSGVLPDQRFSISFPVRSSTKPRRARGSFGHFALLTMASTGPCRVLICMGSPSIQRREMIWPPCNRKADGEF